MTSDCKKLEEDLSAYADGELTVEQQKVVCKHLQNCKKCRQHLKDLKSVWNFLDDYQLQEADNWHINNFFSNTLPSHIFSTKHRSKRYPFAAAILAGISLGILLYQIVCSINISQQKQILQNAKQLKTSEFELIKNLDLIENYEVFEYFTAEMLRQWKKKS